MPGCVQVMQKFKAIYSAQERKKQPQDTAYVVKRISLTLLRYENISLCISLQEQILTYIWRDSNWQKIMC